MVVVVDARNAAENADALKNMHRVRKAVFVDHLGWNVPVVDGEFEADQFDTEAAVYLLTFDKVTHAHLGSVRLLPSTSPHILGDLFGDLCEGDAPRAPDVWEISRLCTTPGLPRERQVRVRHKLSAGLIEYALLLGISRYSCVLDVSWLPTLLAPGWPCEPLGPPATRGKETLGAFAISITPAVLDAFRLRWGGSFPVLDFAGRKAA